MFTIQERWQRKKPGSPCRISSAYYVFVGDLDNAIYEEEIGQKVNDWPRDVRDDSELSKKWLEFRREQITTVVAAVSERGRKIRPGLKISAYRQAQSNFQ